MPGASPPRPNFLRNGDKGQEDTGSSDIPERNERKKGSLDAGWIHPRSTRPLPPPRDTPTRRSPLAALDPCSFSWKNTGRVRPGPTADNLAFDTRAGFDDVASDSA